MTDDISEMLHRTASALPEVPDRLGAVQHRRASRARRRQLTAVATAVVAVGAGTVLFTSLRSSTTTHATPAAREPLYTATGRVVRVPGEPDRACAPLIEAGDGPAYDAHPAPRSCPGYGVEVRGVDFMDVTGRREQGGAIEGTATLQGFLHDGVLVVTKQSPPTYGGQSDRLTAPPCAPPPGGWPRGAGSGDPDMSAVESYRRDHSDAIVLVATARASEDVSLLYVMTTADPEPVADALRPAYGQSLCVTQAHYDPSDVATAFEAVKALGVITIGGSNLLLSGQPSVRADVVQMTPGLQALVDSYPTGMIQVDAWLHPLP